MHETVNQSPTPVVERLRHRPSARSAAVAATVVATIPVLWAIATNVGRRYIPVGDYAIIDIRVRDAASGHLPLLGMYSRFGWYHPGPALFWLVAPLSFLARKQAWATVVGCAALQGFAIAASARVVWRRGGVAVVLGVLAVQSLSYVALESSHPLFLPWNPFVAFPYLVLFLTLVWSVGLGDLPLMPWTVAVGSLLVQLHLGYAVIVAGGFAWCIWVGWIRARMTNTANPESRKPLVVSGIVLAVVWLPAFVQDAQGGNLSKVIRFSLTGKASNDFNLSLNSEKPAGFSVAARVFAAEFHWLPSWLGGKSPIAEHTGIFAAPVAGAYVLVPVALVLCSIVAVRRSRNRLATHAVALTALMVALAVVSLARFRGELTDFAFYWRIPIAILVVATAVASLLTLPKLARRPGTRTMTALCLSVVVVAASAATMDGVVRGAPEYAPVSADAGTIAAQLSPLVPARGRAMLIAPYDMVGVQLAVYDQMSREGRPIALSSRLAAHYFEGRHGVQLRDAAVVWCLVEGTDISVFSKLPGAKLVTALSPLSPLLELEARRLEDALIPQLTAAKQADLIPYLESPFSPRALARIAGVDMLLVRQLATIMNRKRTGHERYAVYAFPPADAPHTSLAS